MSEMTANEASEIMLDATLTLVAGREDDDLILVEGFMRALAEQLNITIDWPEIEPMTAGEFRRRFRNAKRTLAARNEL